jgi:hypothetical protein
MKDPHSVLHEHEKEQALERVRREIQAVLSVIPILVDDQPSSDVVHEVLLAFSPTPVDPSDNDMAQLEMIPTYGIRQVRGIDVHSANRLDRTIRKRL